MVNDFLNGSDVKEPVQEIAAVGEPLLAPEGLDFFEGEVVKEIVILVIVIARLDSFCFHSILVEILVALNVCGLF